MESISKRTGKKFTGKFAETAVRLGLASENPEGNERGETPAKPSEKKTNKPVKVAKKAPAKELKPAGNAKKVTEVEPKVVHAPAKEKPKEVKTPLKSKAEEKPAGNADKTIMVSDQVKEAVSLETKGTQTVKKPAGLKNPLTAKKAVIRKAKK